ncbi:PREDICTED: uncharacterized protein K02A2.6-like [Wasmannia auropunctata]|uniref:uncharacterized protein K02A2.6-like n=1 Tax=Wasmannia auropunctata TaxID=64793 RepID=UPI0005EF80CB|nr:PREDICTED: uncharacterized protein K02A2.6-like [Wasmannia auropunctata]
MSTRKETGWIQDLNKEGLINELNRRGVDFDCDSNYNELRKLLRNVIKESEREDKPVGSVDLERNQEVNAQNDEEDKDAEESADSDTMSDGMKLEFCLHKDDWETFVERTELYFTAKDIKDEKQAAQLLTRLDEDAFKLMKQLAAPEKLSTKTFAELTKLMTDHLNPRPSEVMESCGKKGHLQRVCRKNATGRDKQQLKKFNDGEVPKRAEQPTHRDDFHKIELNDKRKCVRYACDRDNAEPMFLNVNVNDIRVKMEVDTGTYATVISELGHNEFFNGYKIEKTVKELKTYDNKILKPIGKLENLVIEFDDRKARADLFVLPGSGPSLIGRQWLNKLGLWPLKLERKSKISVNKMDVENMKNYFLSKYSDLFSDTPGRYNKSETRLYLKDNTRPVASKCRNVAHALKPLVEKELDRLVKLGHLEPVETSEWATPIVPVFKQNGCIRICGDFKLTVNPHIIIDKYPLHTIDEIFTCLKEGDYYSELDLTHCYMQFLVDKDSRHLLTIITHKGLFRYKNIPEGVSPAPADVQRKMDECLRGIDSAIAYIDNIYVTGKTEIEHKTNLERVCERLSECGLRVNLEKSKFFQKRIEILGFVIDKDGLHKAKSKVIAILNAPRPENKKKLSSFLGLVTFYERFLKDRSANLKPLHDLLGSDRFYWNEDCAKAFEWRVTHPIMEFLPYCHTNMRTD